MVKITTVINYVSKSATFTLTETDLVVTAAFLHQCLICAVLLAASHWYFSTKKITAVINYEPKLAIEQLGRLFRYIINDDSKKFCTIVPK
jgi:hypothetical protein